MENENDDEGDSSTHSWKEMYELDSLSDGDFSDGVISFNESFATGMGAECKKDSNASNVGEDWDAVSEIQTVISVNTFSGNKEMMFSYKDALNVNRKLAPLTIKEEKEAKSSIVNNQKAEKTDLERRDENELHSVHFDHDSAKLREDSDEDLKL